MIIKMNESVMTPTPIPYKYKPVKSRSLELDIENDELSEDVSLSDISSYYNSNINDFVLRIKINDKPYTYVITNSDISIDQMISKLKGIMKYSHGKALAFLKRNSKLFKESKVLELKDSCNPFKSSFICQECGKPLDQCICDIEDEDRVDEEFSSSSATQSSSVSGHKMSSIDLIPNYKCKGKGDRRQ